MSFTAHRKSTGLMLVCFVSVLAAWSLPAANAQSPCVTCPAPQTYVPIYLQFGVDPYRPRQIPYTHFTPLQSPYYQPPSVSRCLPCENNAIQGEPFVVGSPVIAAPETTVAPPAPTVVAAPETEVPEAPKPTPTIEDAGGESAGAKSETDSENTVSSPSDIVLSKRKTGEPTLADDASSKNMAQLDEARKQIARLKAEIADNKEKARIATERAYAAEKAAQAANQAKADAEKSQEQLAAERKQLKEAAAKAIAQVRTTQAAANKLRSQLEAAEKRAQQAPAKTKSEKSDAEKRLAKLRADANQSVGGENKPKGDKSNEKAKDQPNKKAPAPPTNRISEEPKKKPTDDSKKKKRTPRKQAALPAQQQIKNLQESLERQIKTSNTRIRKRNQNEIKKLMDSGKKGSDPEVQALKEKLASDLKANEAKIRKRVEDQIKRLRKQLEK